MAMRISRRKIADYAAERLIEGEKSTAVLRQVAAFLIETKRTREVDLIVRDIEAALAERGVVVADVTSAYPLTDELKKSLVTLVGGKKLQLRETIDPSVLGGIRLRTPDERLDATLKRKIQSLKTSSLSLNET
jgi:F-type H+-transporting ATPase subunit delta